MDAATAQRPASAITPPSSGAAAHAAEVLASEWRKFRTVRSTWWALAAVTVFNVVTAAVLGIVLPKALSADQQAGIKNPVGLSLAACTCPRSRSECSACW